MFRKEALFVSQSDRLHSINRRFLLLQPTVCFSLHNPKDYGDNP